MPVPDPKTWVQLFIDSFDDTTLIILIVSAFVSLAVSLVLLATAVVAVAVYTFLLWASCRVCILRRPNGLLPTYAQAAAVLPRYIAQQSINL